MFSNSTHMSIICFPISLISQILPSICITSILAFKSPYILNWSSFLKSNKPNPYITVQHSLASKYIHSLIVILLILSLSPWESKPFFFLHQQRYFLFYHKLDDNFCCWLRPSILICKVEYKRKSSKINWSSIDWALKYPSGDRAEK